jgi:TetR/AcrR family transcriptional regulator, transcriptional repressor for nem operon
MPRKTDKRVRLVDAAKALIHRQGFNLTTLADIAQEADVPLGNVYYYFKTKEAIGEAVITNRGRELHEALQAF